jgi:hypothetical protein
MTPATIVRGLVSVALSLFAAGAVGCTGPTPPDPDAALRSQLAAHRQQQIERLHAYAVTGQFPHNLTSPDSIHIFRDADGRYCAVANLVHQDGRDELVEATVRDRNDLAIHDVHDGPMMAWILESGLTKEELERIQFPSVPFFHSGLDRLPVAAPRPSPVDEVALKNAPAPRAMRVMVDARDEDAMKTLVRAHIARVEAELRSSTEASLALATTRAHAQPPPQRVASR